MMNEAHTVYMTLSELLKPELVLIKAESSSKDELIFKLVEKIIEANLNFHLSQESLLAAICKREQIGGTLLPSGLSVPHARLGDYEGFIFAIGTSKEPILHDGNPLHLMSVLISSQSGGPYYLPTVAALTKLSRDAEYFSRLSGSANKEEFFKILKERDPVLG